MTTSTAFSAVETGILLEAGTTEAELLVFQVGEQTFGVNLAKVREVLPVEALTPMPLTHEAVDGLVTIRDLVVPLDLRTYLKVNGGNEAPAEDSLILLEFNRQHVAFRVQSVDRIHRVTWKDTPPAPQLGSKVSPVTSIWRLDASVVPLIDFEAITASIVIGGNSSGIGSLPASGSADRDRTPIIFADDSVLISEMIRDSLAGAGFNNLTGFGDGDELWRYLDDLTKTLSPEQVKESVACVVTDIEMPQMDGLSLTRMIRNTPATAHIPVIVYSSIASDDNMKKGEQVGATSQIAKPRYDDLVRAVVELSL